MHRILIAGIGNIFLGDDAFGVEVVAQLSRRTLPAGVHVVDFGIRGLDLTYALLDPYEAVILVDAMPRGGPPGQLYVLEVDAPVESEETSSCGVLNDMHSLDPEKVLRLVSAMGGRLSRLLVVGCEPTPLDEYEDIQPGLSDPVLAAIPQAVESVLRLLGELVEKRDPDEPRPMNPAVGMSIAAQQEQGETS
ncbi:MAG TPA: hydrogenase maturation protease [Pirellulales bacterium]|jgi:hydrogenase maturation protease|nr:hydrogenase maturation protease [Pirellulales bacterium]